MNLGGGLPGVSELQLPSALASKNDGSCSSATGDTGSLNLLCWVAFHRDGTMTLNYQLSLTKYGAEKQVANRKVLSDWAGEKSPYLRLYHPSLISVSLPRFAFVSGVDGNPLLSVVHRGKAIGVPIELADLGFSGWRQRLSGGHLVQEELEAVLKILDHLSLCGREKMCSPIEEERQQHC